MARRVFLHVGAPKTGTTFLQDTLAANRAGLADAGLTYPDTRSGSHFEAAIDLIEHPWGGALDRARGSWDQVASSAMRSRGDAIVSHEVLASASSEQVRRAQESFAGSRAARHLLGPRPRPADPGRVAGDRQAPRPDAVRPVPPRRREGPPHRLRGVVLAGAGTPRRARPVERRPEPGARPPAHGPTARRRAGPALGALRRHPRRRPGTGGGDRPAHERVARRDRDGVHAPAQRRAQGALDLAAGLRRHRARTPRTADAVPPVQADQDRAAAGEPTVRRRGHRRVEGVGAAAPASTWSATSPSSRRGGATGSGPTPTGHDHGP